MNNIIGTFEKEQIQKLTSNKRIPAFRSGDTVKVTLKIVEGERTRLQVFEGVCIARKNNGLNSNFTIRKISHGEGVEKVFPLFSSLIDKIDIIRKGDVRRAKLYYLRDRKGKSARIAEKIKKNIGIEVEVKDEITTDVSQGTSTEKKETPKVEAKKQEISPSKKTTEKKEIKKQENLKK